MIGQCAVIGGGNLPQEVKCLFRGHAAPNVVTVPLLPLYLSAPDST